MNKTKSKTNNKSKCANCLEERKKADRSRKYAHELKNIFITISTVVNSEIETPTANFSSLSGNTSHFAESGDVSPFIMEGRKHRINSKINNNSNNNSSINNNTDSPFYFLKTLCDYGKTLIKEINELGKDYTDNNKQKVMPFNISKAIDFCVDMFDTKRKYDKAKKNLQIFSDINFSYDKEIESITETGFKMVLINLLTNSYKFTVKGKIIVRAVSIPKEKKIRILVKDSGKGFNPNDFIKNGCFYVYEKNQELNADGSGLGLTIVNEILTKFNIKLDCISSTEKGGSLFYFDLDDTYPYYDEINPHILMSNSLNQILKDINSGKKDKEYNEFNNNFNSFTNILKINNANNFKDNIINMNNKNLNNKSIENENIDNSKISNKNLGKPNTNNIISIKNEKQRFSFKDYIDINISPTFNHNTCIYQATGKKVSIPNIKNSIERSIRNDHSETNILNKGTQLSNKKENYKMTKGSFGNIETNNSNISNSNIMTPCMKKLDRMFSIKRFSMQNESSKKEGKTNILKQVIADGHRYQKMKTFNFSGKKGREMQSVKVKEKKKSIDTIYNLIEKKEESENEDLKEMDEEIKKMR
jgi:signal transduction histidine kinase